MIHIYTGNGKGKTTAAIGLAIRALGWNYRVCIVQFLKDRKCVTGELTALCKYSLPKKNLKIIRFNQIHPIFCARKKLVNYSRKNLKKSLSKAIIRIKRIVKRNNYDIIILDELINAVSQGFLKEDSVIDLIKAVRKDSELILTGRGATNNIIKLADYVTEMKQIKHPFQRRVLARKAIEF